MPLRRVLRTAAVVLVAAGATGCAPEPSTLLDDLADRVDRSGDLTYTATYRLPDGGTATLAQAQDPRRAAYTWPAGRVVLADRRTTMCHGTTCTTTTAATASTEPALDAVAATGPTEPGVGSTAGDTLVSPRRAIRLASDAAAHGTPVTRHQERIAGQPATCFGVAGGFTACLTDRGVLASFHDAGGTVTLTDFRRSADLR
jgi:hypothetical protein